MVRPRMAPLKRALSFLRMTKGSSQLLVGPAVSLEREQMKVRSSTRATSLGAERARKQPGQSFSLSLVKVPAWTSWLQRKSYSACEPSIQWMRSGWQRSAIFSTQRMRCLLVVGGVAIAVSTATVFIGWGKFLRVQVFALAEGLSTLRASDESRVWDFEATYACGVLCQFIHFYEGCCLLAKLG